MDDNADAKTGDSPLSQRSVIAKIHYCRVMYKLINFCILALGSGQHLLYRLGSGLVLRCNAVAHTVLHVSCGPLR